MAAVRRLGFWKLAVFIMWPLSACRYASVYKISTKSDNRRWVMAKKANFKMAAAAILNSKNCNFWWRDCNRVQYLMLAYKTSSKSDNFSLRYGDLTIFKMAAVRHLKFYIFAFFVPSRCQHAVLLSHTKFCWNRTIGQWFMAKKAIFKMAAAVLNFRNFNFWSRDCNRVQYLM